jgi:hypothetical protein
MHAAYFSAGLGVFSEDILVLNVFTSSANRSVSLCSRKEVALCNEQRVCQLMFLSYHNQDTNSILQMGIGGSQAGTLCATSTIACLVDTALSGQRVRSPFIKKEFNILY